MPPTESAPTPIRWTRWPPTSTATSPVAVVRPTTVCFRVWPFEGAHSQLKERIATELESVRKRSLALLEPVSNDDLLRQHSPLMSPLVLDLAHIGNYEE